MNLILLFEADFVGTDRVCLRGRRAAHVREVHRAAVGDTLRVGVAGGDLGTGRVTVLDADRVEMAVVLCEPPPPALPLTLLLALPRPKSLKRVVQALAGLGVKHIVLMATARVEKSYWESPVVTEPALREQVVLGLEQAQDTVLPRIELRRRFKPFVEDEVAELSTGSLALVAHPVASAPCPRGVTGPVTLAIGPEGGFVPYEVGLLEAHGFTAVSLGARRLRVEHVVPALLGRLF